MSEFPWLPVLGGIPAFAALVVTMLPKGRDLLGKQIALAASLLVLAFTIAMGIAYDPGAGGGNGWTFQFAESVEWIPQFGVHFAYGVDGIALVMIALVAVLVPVVILASWKEIGQARWRAGRGEKAFFALVLILETLMIGVFAATDVFLFYVFFEAMLVPMYFIIGSFGGPQRSYAAMKFLIYSLLGGLLMLAAVIGLFVVSADQLGEGTFALSELINLDFSPGVEKALFLGFFIAFAIKAPLWPFHTWLPDAATESPTGGAVLLVGVLDKVGTFGFLRYCIPLFPAAAADFAPYIVALSVISIFYGAVLAMGQRDMKRLIAYTSVAHFGFIALGIFALTSQGQAGGVLYMVNHGLSTGALFLIAGFLISRRSSRLIPDYGGVAKVAPWLSGAFLVVGMSALALPGLNSFVSEFLVLVGTFTRYRVAAIIAAVGIVLAALYILLWYKRTMQGPLRAGVEGMRDLSLREGVVLAPLVVLIIGLGVYPKPLLEVIGPAVSTTLETAGQSDPVPEHPVDITADPAADRLGDSADRPGDPADTQTTEGAAQ